MDGVQEAAMTTGAIRTKRVIGLFLLGYLLFNYPLIALVNLPRTFMGIPLLYGYLFGVWLILIILTALIVRSDA